MTTDDLWPSDLLAEIPRTPAQILAEQGDLLAKKTKGLILGKVTIETESYSDQFHICFVLRVPTLGSYEYTLLRIAHDETLYPVTAGDESLDSEPAFNDFLKKFLASERTVRLIRALIAQVHAQSTGKAKTPIVDKGSNDDFPF